MCLKARVILYIHKCLYVVCSYLLMASVKQHGPQMHTSVLLHSSLSVGRWLLSSVPLIRPFTPSHWLSFTSERTWTTWHLMNRKVKRVSTSATSDVTDGQLIGKYNNIHQPSPVQWQCCYFISWQPFSSASKI